MVDLQPNQPLPGRFTRGPSLRTEDVDCEGNAPALLSYTAVVARSHLPTDGGGEDLCVVVPAAASSSPPSAAATPPASNAPLHISSMRVKAPSCLPSEDGAPASPRGLRHASTTSSRKAVKSSSPFASALSKVAKLAKGRTRKPKRPPSRDPEPDTEEAEAGGLAEAGGGKKRQLPPGVLTYLGEWLSLLNQQPSEEREEAEYEQLARISFMIRDLRDYKSSRAEVSLPRAEYLCSLFRGLVSFGDVEGFNTPTAFTLAETVIHKYFATYAVAYTRGQWTQDKRSGQTGSHDWDLLVRDPTGRDTCSLFVVQLAKPGGSFADDMPAFKARLAKILIYNFRCLCGQNISELSELRMYGAQVSADGMTLMAIRPVWDVKREEWVPYHTVRAKVSFALPWGPGSIHLAQAAFQVETVLSEIRVQSKGWAQQMRVAGGRTAATSAASPTRNGTAPNPKSNLHYVFLHVRTEKVDDDDLPQASGRGPMPASLGSSLGSASLGSASLGSASPLSTPQSFGSGRTSPASPRLTAIAESGLEVLTKHRNRAVSEPVTVASPEERARRGNSPPRSSSAPWDSNA